MHTERGRKPLPPSRRLRYSNVGLSPSTIATVKKLTGEEKLSTTIRECVMVGISVLKTIRTVNPQTEDNNNG